MNETISSNSEKATIGENHTDYRIKKTMDFYMQEIKKRLRKKAN